MPSRQADLLRLSEIPLDANILNTQEYEQVLRKELRRLRELQFYRNQRNKRSLVEIENLLEDIRENNLVGGQVYAPAFFEWAIWRLFLAINHIEGLVSETRGFQIDEDMQPIHHAKGDWLTLSLRIKILFLFVK